MREQRFVPRVLTGAGLDNWRQRKREKDKSERGLVFSKFSLTFPRRSYAIDSCCGTVHALSHTDTEDVIMLGFIPPWEQNSKYIIA